MDILATRLKQLRIDNKLSQAKIALLANTTQASINRYENGNNYPPINILLWYADFFDVSLDYIFGRTDCPQGIIYGNNPNIPLESNSDLDKFVEMCFDPSSPISKKLKTTLANMLKEEVDKK